MLGVTLRQTSISSGCMDLYGHMVKSRVCSYTSLLIPEFSGIERLGIYLDAVLVYCMHVYPLHIRPPYPQFIHATGRRETPSDTRLKTQDTPHNDPGHGLNLDLSIWGPTCMRPQRLHPPRSELIKNVFYFRLKSSLIKKDSDWYQESVTLTHNSQRTKTLTKLIKTCGKVVTSSDSAKTMLLVQGQILQKKDPGFPCTLWAV